MRGSLALEELEALLLLLALEAFEPESSREEKKKQEDKDSKHILLSPSIPEHSGLFNSS